MSKFLGINALEKVMMTMSRNYSSVRSGRGKGESQGPLIPQSPEISAVPLPPLDLKTSSAKELREVSSKISPEKSASRNNKKFPFPNMDDQGLPLLNPKDCFRRVEFASKMLQILEKDPEVLDSILFTDEGNFQLSKTSQKPVHEVEQTKEGRSKTVKAKRRKVAESQPLPQIVWCGMTSKHVIGPYFFNSYVTDRTYLKMLRTYLIPQMRRTNPNGSIDECWFQQDGAPPHRSKLVLPHLTETFGSHLISYGCPLAWPPKSQDLTPLDYFFWEHLKDKMIANYLPDELTTRIGFRPKLAKQIEDIEEETLKMVIDEFPIRLEKCLEADGHRFDMD